MKRLSGKFIAMILVVSFILSSAPDAFASSGVQEQSNYTSTSITDDKSYQAVSSKDAEVIPETAFPKKEADPSIIQEDISKRTKFTKEFLRSDSSHLMVLYPEAVHYKKDGKWEDIDNTLVAKKDKDNNDVLENTANDINIKLPASFAPGKPISMTKDGYTLQFVLIGAYASVKWAIKSADGNLKKGLSENQQKTVSTKLESALTYANVLPNIDIQYNVGPGQLKESVIVKQLPAAPLTYTYLITADKLLPVIQKDNTINFYPANNPNADPVFIMPAPFMVDANGEVNYDVGITLDTTNDQCKLTYAPSMDWMSEPKRAWPVVIDPVVVADLSIDNIRDQQVDSNKDNVSHTSSYIEAGHHTTYGIERIFLMYDDLPDLSAADVVVDANVQIYRPYDSSVISEIEVHKVNATWDSSTLQSDNQPACDPLISDYQMVQNAGWYTWQITDIARGWYAGSNTGMMFKLPDSVENETASDNKTFYSSDNGTGYRPILYIVFRNNCGLESYWNYHTQDVGRAGTGNINDYTGNLVFVHDDIGFDGNLMPVSIRHIYNANDAKSNSFGCGYGWRTNYNQRVYQWTKDPSYYVWEDEDGTRHYF